MELAEYKACICEGSAENAIMDILLDHELLIFSREEMIEEEVIRCREGKKFEEKYLRKGFMNKMLYDEIIPTLPLDKNDLTEFAAAVEDRFNNPFVDHELMSISLNSTSKWRARNLPSFKEYIAEEKRLPVCLTMSLAAYIAFYSNEIQERFDLQTPERGHI